MGCAVTTAPGLYGYVRAYGQEGRVWPPIPGMGSGEAMAFRVNGVVAGTAPARVLWSGDYLAHQVHLSVPWPRPCYLPMLLKRG